jgi:NADPH:quinone reductase-like Zn-dependent oxidoreductase
MRAVRLTAFGNPVDGLEYVDILEPDAPGPNQVLIGVEFSPINANDLMLAQGIYAFRPQSQDRQDDTRLDIRYRSSPQPMSFFK